SLGIDVARAGWVMNAYFVLLVGGVLIAGRLGDAFGHGKLLRLAWLVFAAGALLAALSNPFPLLVAARGVQGVGSAMIFGTSLALVATAFSGPRLAWAVGILTVFSGLASVIGTWASTTIIEVTTWQMSFLVPCALGVAITACAGGLPSQRRLRLADIDWLGGVLLF